MKKIILSFVFLFLLLQIKAQQIITTGVIKFERKTNVHKQLDEMGWNAGWIEEMKKKVPKYQITNFDLLFNNATSIYKKGEVQPSSTGAEAMMGMQPDEDKNIVYKNIDSNKLVSQKQFFEKLISIQDSLPKMNWHFTNEYKMIAGYNCRKATAISLDSVFVIAYYTDAITTDSGPENFNGLPGMILGVHLPRLATTYMAKSIEIINVKQDQLLIPTKGAKYTFKDLAAKINSSMSDWGNKMKDRILWSYLL
jgi:GLPGLI family protein